MESTHRPRQHTAILLRFPGPAPSKPSHTRIEDEGGKVTVIPGAPAAFRIVYVFEISQTGGEELVEASAMRLEGDDPAIPIQPR